MREAPPQCTPVSSSDGLGADNGHVGEHDDAIDDGYLKMAELLKGLSARVASKGNLSAADLLKLAQSVKIAQEIRDRAEAMKRDRKLRDADD